jgi:hypothetical protein
MMPALGGGQAAVSHQNAMLHAFKLLDRELHEYARFTSSILSSAFAGVLPTVKS